MKVTHIVPLFAPVIDGVGDYALNLARNLRAMRGIESEFVVCDLRWSGANQLDSFAVFGPTGFQTERFGAAIANATTIMLHYVGYAFDPRGLPDWLLSALQKWQRTDASRKLLTVFHEIWSSGPPWRKVFYLAPMQRKLAGKILELSSHAFGSTHAAVAALETLKRGGVTWQPISSNIEVAGSALRSRTIAPWRPIFFGQAWTRLPAIRAHRKLIETLHERGILDRVLVMGKESHLEGEDLAELRSFLPREKIEALGEMSFAEAHGGFDGADFALSAHPAADVCKSSALMCAIACGCPVIVPTAANAEPLRAGRDFVACDGSKSEVNRVIDLFGQGALPGVGAAARAWYEANASWERTVERVAARLGA